MGRRLPKVAAGVEARVPRYRKAWRQGREGARAVSIWTASSKPSTI